MCVCVSVSSCDEMTAARESNCLQSRILIKQENIPIPPYIITIGNLFIQQMQNYLNMEATTVKDKQPSVVTN